MNRIDEHQLKISDSVNNDNKCTSTPARGGRGIIDITRRGHRLTAALSTTPSTAGVSSA
jgi:hypothetical protein